MNWAQTRQRGLLYACGANVALNSTRNNLPDIAELVSRMYIHRSELTLTPSQLMQFEA
jgi:hypothetical protein